MAHLGNFTSLKEACHKHGVALTTECPTTRQQLHRPLGDLHADIRKHLKGVTVGGTAAMTRRELELAAEGHGILSHAGLADQLLAQAVDNFDKARDLTDNSKTSPRQADFGTPNGPNVSAP